MNGSNAHAEQSAQHAVSAVPESWYTASNAAGVLRGDAKEQRKFAVFCRRISWRHVRSCGVKAYADDIAQDVAVAVIADITMLANGEIDAAAFGLRAYNAARNIAHRYQRIEQRDRVRLESLSNDPADEPRHNKAASADAVMYMDPEAASIAHEEASARNAAMLSIKNRLKQVPTPRLVRAKAASRGPQKSQSRASMEANKGVLRDPASLHELLIKLGWSERSAAQKLGMTSWPSDAKTRFADKGHLLYRQVVNIISPMTAYQVTIDDILRGWAEHLGFEHGDREGIAERLGIHPVTLFRWETGRIVPSPRVLSKLSLRVFGNG